MDQMDMFAVPVDDIPPRVRQLFEQYALQLIDSGWAHYSARAILHRIRWHMHVERGDRAFKCNNNWTPTMAREFHVKHPRHDGFFETRRSPGTVPLEERLPGAAE